VLLHPAGRIEPAEAASLVAERRFGTKTEAYVSEVKSFPEVFAHARAATPGKAMFRSRTEVTGNTNYGVARRPETVAWTVFYLVTEDVVNARLTGMARQRMLIAGVCILLALGAGILVAATILGPLGALSTATAAIAAGDLSARVRPRGRDELGKLSLGFNTMAERIGAQASALEKARDELELRVEERTAELTHTTERLRVEIAERERAVEAKTQLAAIVESSDDAIIGKTLEGVITSWNSGAQRLFGYTGEEIIGRPMALLISDERAHEEPAILARIARGESVEHFETERVRKDGSRLNVSATISPIRDAQGRIVGASHITRDITASKRAEARLQAQLARMNLLDQISCAIGERQDLQSIYQVVIRSLEDQLPLDFACVCRFDAVSNTLVVTSVGAASQALAMDLVMTEQARIEIDQNGLSRCVQGDLVYEPDAAKVAFPFPQRLARSGLHSVVMAPLQAERRVFGILVSARRHVDGFSSTDCEFLRQLTQHVALAAQQAHLYGELQQAYDDLRQTQQAVMQQERLRALGQMASGIAHDINNALSPAALYTQSLLEREENLSPRARDCLEQIDRAISDVASTVARMREFYRQREPQMAFTTVQLNQLVRQVLELTRARWSDMAQQRGTVIDAREELADDLPAVLGVESEIREAFMNLMLNAIDAMPEGGVLTVRTRRDFAPAKHACVEIIDTGVGMDEETRRRCLEPFYTTKGERGTGLGLAMVYGILQRHGADLEIDSAPGQGTTMRLRFAVPEKTAVAPLDELVVDSAQVQRLRILVIDDDPLLLKSLQDTLEGEGHTVQTANGGRAGIEAAEAAQAAGSFFSVVITDLGMPYVDGRKVASAIKHLSSDTPVILLTGWGQRLVAEGEVPDHVDQVLSKPPKLRELRASLALYGGRSNGRSTQH
jgi:PAS domain S-box-containing protein